MKKKRMMNAIAWLWVLAAAGISSPLAGAEAPAAHEAILSEIEQLESLREKDVARYREAVSAKKEKLKSRMGGLGERHPEKFQAFLGKEKEIREERLRYFRENHPRAFDRFMERRMGRLNRLAERHPERFQRFAANHPRFRERFEGQLQRRRMAAGGVETRRGDLPLTRPIERRRNRDPRPLAQLGQPPSAHEPGERKRTPERSNRGGPRRRR